MTVIRVNPASVVAYGNSATEIFGRMHSELENLVSMVTEVQYYGPNAVDFKTRCGTLAQTFAQSIHADMAAMADAVRVSVSNIQGSLGGAQVHIQVDGKTIEAPAVASVDFVDVDTTALEGLGPSVTTKFSTIEGLLDDHVSRLTHTDWEGNAKVQAVTSINTSTTQAKARCMEGREQITTYIDNQLAAVLAADR